MTPLQRVGNQVRDNARVSVPLTTQLSVLTLLPGLDAVGD
jgi:hypothetical protein